MAKKSPQVMKAWEEPERRTKNVRNPIEIIDRNYVIVSGTRVDRPAGTAPSQWLQMWEASQKAAERYTPYRA